VAYYGIPVTDAVVAAEADRIFDEVSEEGQTREDFLAVRGITEEFLDNIARQGLYDQQIREILNEDVAEPTQDEIDEARVEAEAAQEDAAAAGTTVCVSHILVATEAEAEDVMTRLEGGEDLGELAGELSLDTGSGENNGILPCGPASTYVEPFMEASLVAPVGEVYDEIVESEFGFHVILVTDRQEPEPPEPPTDEQLIEAIKANAVVTELEDWFLSSIEEADVTVDEQYGTWQPNPPQVVPPVS
jgi:parvulin-like peptidyl-prolyl isomerase